MSQFFRLQEINFQLSRDLAKVLAKHKGIGGDKNALFQEIIYLKEVMKIEASQREAEIRFKDNIIQDFELIITELSSLLANSQSSNTREIKDWTYNDNG